MSLSFHYRQQYCVAVFQLRDYQQEAVTAVLKHFRKTNESAVIVLPTGSGKSLVIAELARLAKRKILVLTHVKELVDQNHQKYKIVHKDLINGSYVVTGKELNKILDESVKEVIKSKEVA